MARISGCSVTSSELKLGVHGPRVFGCFCSGGHPIAGVVTLRSEPIVPWGKRGEMHLLAAHMFTVASTAFVPEWVASCGRLYKRFERPGACRLAPRSRLNSLITLQKWWSGAGSNCRPFRFSGASAASPDVAGCGLMGHLAAPTMAGCRLMWPDACRRWLPVWLPGTGGRGWIEASQHRTRTSGLGQRTGHRAQRPRPDPTSIVRQYRAPRDDGGAGLTHR
jgi:hypothetical protein